MSFSDLLSLGANFLSGGFIGGIFGFLGKFAELAKLKEQNRHRETMMDKETEHLKMELETRAQIVTTESNAQIEVAASQAFAASYDNDARRYLSDKALNQSKVAAFLMGMVDWLRGITRPVLTVALCIMAYMIFMQTVDLVAKLNTPMTPDQAYQIYMVCIRNILELAGLAVGWWFGSRPSQVGSLARAGRM